MKEPDARELLRRMPSREAARHLNVDPRTLRNWHRRGKIKGERTAAGRWLWDVAGYMEQETGATS